MTQDLVLEFNSGIPVYKQIVNHMGALVANGRLKEGDSLPTIRRLSGELNVNPNTVAKAYRELELTGIIEGHRGSGSFVSASSGLPALSSAQKKKKLRDLYLRMVAEAKSCLILEEDVRKFILAGGA